MAAAHAERDAHHGAHHGAELVDTDLITAARAAEAPGAGRAGQR